MTAFDQVRQTFALERLPANIRASNLVGSLPVLRRYRALPIRMQLFSAKGEFFYNRQSTSSKVIFNGRNLQYHALYDPQYKFGYELETACLLATLCRGDRPFFDIGSNWGYFSLLAAALPQFSGLIYAFEPNPRSFGDLTCTIGQAGIVERVHACNVGVGSTAHEMVVAELDENNTGLSRLVDAGTGRRVKVVPIDAMEYGSPEVIKIDAEGMELDILSGAVKTLKSASPFVVFENFLDYKSPHKTYGTLEFLQAHSYRIFVPILKFSIAGCSIVSTYGQDFTLLGEQDPNPQLGAVEISCERRFLLNDQLNLLAVPAHRISDLWEAGVLNMGKM